MAKLIQVMVRFLPSQRKALRRAKIETGMTEQAILNEAFAQWNAQRKREAAARE